jgi:hypothetical protein
MGEKCETLTEEIECHMVILSAKSTEMHSMLKVKNAQHFDIQTVLYWRIQEYIYSCYILMINIQQTLSTKKGRQFQSSEAN